MDSTGYSSVVVLYDKPEHCRECPVSLYCLAGRSLNHAAEKYNRWRVSGCIRCNAVHFHIEGKHYICTNIRKGLHPRVHPLFHLWDTETQEVEGQNWVMGAIADSDGNCENTPELQSCAKAFPNVPYKKHDCIAQYRNEAKSREEFLSKVNITYIDD